MSDEKDGGAGFTPGPWEVQKPRLGCYEIAGPNGEDLGFFNMSDGADEPTAYPALNNATLAAAAPAMFEALAVIASASNWSVPHIDSPGANTLAEIVGEMQRIACAALSQASQAQGAGKGGVE
jgi:hypothetical protein